MQATLELKRTSDRETLADTVYASLLDAIIDGGMPSGTILSEVAVAKDLDVSRTPVHNAIVQLARDGLVEQSSGRRARVARFTRDDLFEVFEMRKFLEGPAAELAAGRMDQRQLAPLRAAVDELERTIDAADWNVRWIDHDDEFHGTIAKASGNTRLANDIDRYRLLHRGFNRLFRKEAPLQQAVDEHKRILDGLESRDGAAAREAMVDHLIVWQKYFVQHFPR
jgi:DNA-binding GntR family transcriptional regulator